MSRLRASMILLAICGVALVMGVLRVASQRTPLPTGSSYSAEPNGARALFAWIEAVGGSSRHLSETVIRDDQLPSTLVVLQPEGVIDAGDGRSFDSVPEHGGTLLVAGDSLGWLVYVRSFGVAVEPIQSGSYGLISADGALNVPVRSRYRVHAENATPLLLTSEGDWAALRMPYKHGTLVVLATPEPLLNENLRNERTARFVFGDIVSGLSVATVAFDEVHHSFAPSGLPGAPATLSTLLFNTAPGRSVVYVSILIFTYLLLRGRRLGPPLPARPPAETRRTMFEHVQMLANLYRRGGQLSVVRSTFSRHYTRSSARGGGPPGRATVLSATVARVDSARTESDLISAVAAASDASRV